MKTRFYNIFGVALLALTLASCEDYLDKNMDTTQKEEFTFSSYENAKTVAYAVYSDLPQGFDVISGAMLASACDECEFAIQTNNVQKFNLGSWRANSLPENPISRYYAATRKAYNFLEKADDIDYSDVKDNPSQPGIYETYVADIEMLKTEVKLLKAYYLFELIRRFGGMPIVEGKFAVDVDLKTIERASLEDCVNFIVDACDEAAGILPTVWPDASLGRVTKGAALAIKAEVLLYAASDLWNTSNWASGYSNPELISLPAADRAARWKAAADAAKAVIDLSGEAGYILDNYSNLFGAKGYTSKEVILTARAAASNSFEKTNYPISFDYATGGNCPTQNLVDLFQMADGSKFDWNNPAMKADPYANRDPRLAATIITNNTTFNGRTIECWTGGRDGAGVRNCTPTGYYLKKYVYQSDLTQGQTSVHTWILIRLAEVYLNYIEALNEYDPGNADIATYYNLIRSRNGVGMPGLPNGLSQSEVRQAIRDERAVELCFEGKRMFDLRRWMAADVLGAPIRSVRITKTDSGFEYEPYQLETRAFEPKMYFYPIPQSELNKMAHWQQNPLW